MTVALRPMTTGELLDRTFNIYRNKFALFAGISAVGGLFYIAALALLVVLGVTLPKYGAHFNPQATFATLGLYFLVLGLFYLVGASLVMGATIYAVSKAYLEQSVTISESYSKVSPLLGRIIWIVLSIIIRLIGMLILVYLVALALIFAVSFAFAGARGSSAGIVVGILLFGIIIVGYVCVFRLYLKYSLAIQAYVLEKTDAGDSLQRSSFLSKGSLGRIFLIYLLMGIIGAALGFVLQLPGLLLARIAAPLAIQVWGFIAAFLAVTISFPISTIAISLLYYDQRVRKEAFDLQVMMEAIGQGPQAVSAAPIG